MCPKGAPDGKPLCINRSQLCDEKHDCEDGADEEAACCKCNLIMCLIAIISLVATMLPLYGNAHHVYVIVI